MKTGVIFGIVPDSTTRVRCTICGVYIPKATNCIEEHTNGSRHKENKELMRIHGIRFNIPNLYCKPCNVFLSEEESIYSHVESDGHANWIALIYELTEGEFINFDPYLACESDVFKCEACTCNIAGNLQSIELHVNSLAHRSSVVDTLEPVNGLIHLDNEDEVWCKVCEVFLDNTTDEVMKHIDEDENHVGWFTEIEDLTDDQEVIIDKFLTDIHEKHAYCNRCEQNIYCTIEDIENHVMSESHLSS